MNSNSTIAVNQKSRRPNYPKQFVTGMFDAIAPTYDFLNHLLSFDIDKKWRRKAFTMVPAVEGKKVLDVACGTGDFALEAVRRGARSVSGVDPSVEMLRIAEQKRRKRFPSAQVDFKEGNAEELPFETASFDVVTAAFGVRNFGDLPKGLLEMRRVLAPGGTVLILEFSNPDSTLLGKLFTFYSSRIIPFVGNLISGHSSAYSYLHRTSAAFLSSDEFESMLRETRFENLTHRRFTFGVATAYVGTKPMAERHSV